MYSVWSANLPERNVYFRGKRMKSNNSSQIIKKIQQIVTHQRPSRKPQKPFKHVKKINPQLGNVRKMSPIMSRVAHSTEYKIFQIKLEMDRIHREQQRLKNSHHSRQRRSCRDEPIKGKALQSFRMLKKPISNTFLVKSYAY